MAGEASAVVKRSAGATFFGVAPMFWVLQPMNFSAQERLLSAGGVGKVLTLLPLATLVVGLPVVYSAPPTFHCTEKLVVEVEPAE